MTIFAAPSWIVFPVVIPLAASLLGFLFRRWSVAVSLAAAVVTLVSTGIIAGQLALSGPVRYSLGGWPAPLGITLRFDGPTVLMLIMTAIAGMGISLYARGYFPFGKAEGKHAEHAKREEIYFWPLWMMLWAGLNGLFLSSDIFNIYVTLEIVGISAAALTSLSGTSASHIAAFRYLLVSMLGSLSYILGVAFLYRFYGVLDLDILQGLAVGTPGIRTALALMTIGLLLKTALFPMHFWLPPAHSTALSPVSAILSGLVVKGPFYLLFRFWFDIFHAAVTESALVLLGFLGTCSIVWGAIHALRQQRLKLLVAYSTVSQIGYLFVAFPLAEKGAGPHIWSAVIFMAMAHAFAKTAMFMAAGTILLHTGHDRISELAGVRADLPITVLAFAVAGVNIIGIPPSGGFIAKWMMITSSLDSSQWWWGLIIGGGSLLAAAYVFKVVSRLFVIPPGYPAVGTQSRLVLLEWSALTLALVSLLMGLVAPWVFVILSRAEKVGRVFASGGFL